jgi:glycosyltransferase involved in cell wall biosynthesis
MADMINRWLPAYSDSSLVSVIIPTYNRAHIILETLDSVAVQDYRPIELIVIDDGSTDDTQDIVDNWKKANQRSGLTISYYRQKNAGAASARNYGARVSRGAYIQFLDSDDIMLPNKISLSVDKIVKNNAYYAACGFVRFKGNKDNIINGSPKDNKPFSVDINPLDRRLCTQSLLYRIETLQTIGPWNEVIPIMDDTEYALRLLASRLPGIWIPEVLILARWLDGSLMNRHPRTTTLLTLEAVRIIEATAQRLGAANNALHKDIGRILSGYSRWCMRLNLVHEARMMEQEAYKYLRTMGRLEHVLRKCAGK